MNDIVKRKQVEAYMDHLEREERSEGTRIQYQRELTRFFDFLQGKELKKEIVIAYKKELERCYKPTSVNTKLAAVNGFLNHIGRSDLKVKQLKIQRQVYCPARRELSKAEYMRLIEAARAQKGEKLSLLIQTLCSTGIRVSELKFITVEAVGCGEAIIQLKGKTRVVLIAGKLKKALRRYIRQQRIQSGAIFVTKKGNPMDRSNIWRMMKKLCQTADVEQSKVFPHNLRHLFARTFYAMDKDLAKLADVMGHSNINTTRIYIISSGREHRRCIDALGLVV